MKSNIPQDIKNYSLIEVTEILQVTRRTLYTYIKEGKLKAVKVGREWRVPHSAIREFLGVDSKEI